MTISTLAREGDEGQRRCLNMKHRMAVAMRRRMMTGIRIKVSMGVLGGGWWMTMTSDTCWVSFVSCW